jgi:hypothetical protein
MTYKFELSADQQARVDAWFKHHWEVVHAGFRPREMTGVAVKFTFIPTGMGPSSQVECVWCKEGHQGHAVDLTEDDEGGFIYEYDENWNRLPASWEKKD